MGFLSWINSKVGEIKTMGDFAIHLQEVVNRAKTTADSYL